MAWLRRRADLRVRDGGGGKGGGSLMDVPLAALLEARSALLLGLEMTCEEDSRRVERVRRERIGEEKKESTSLRLGVRLRIGLVFIVAADNKMRGGS